MASAAGLLSPGLVSLVKRAQQLREEMDEEPTKLVAMDANSLPRKNGRQKVNLLGGCVICRDKCSASKIIIEILPWYDMLCRSLISL